MKNFFYILLFTTQATFAQAVYVEADEELMFSFRTNKGRQTVLAKAKNDSYLVYRFGTKDKIEMEYPSDKENSWSKFKYSTYFRGGGKANAGLEIENIIFENGDFKYVVYYDYSAEEDRYTTGVLVMNTKTGKETNIEGNPDTVEGVLLHIRETGRLEEADERY